MQALKINSERSLIELKNRIESLLLSNDKINFYKSLNGILDSEYGIDFFNNLSNFEINNDGYSREVILKEDDSDAWELVLIGIPPKFQTTIHRHENNKLCFVKILDGVEVNNVFADKLDGEFELENKDSYKLGEFYSVPFDKYHSVYNPEDYLAKSLHFYRKTFR